MADVMRKAVVPLVVALGVPGCFYMDPVNERPSADIDRVSPEQPMRGESITVTAEIYDPDGDDTQAAWRAYACRDDQTDCGDPFVTGGAYTFDFQSPQLTATGEPANVVRVELDVTDAYGAMAAPDQDLIINLANAVPTIEPLQSSGRNFRGSYPVGTTVRIAAQIDDADDGALSLDESIDTTLYPPDDATLENALLDYVEERSSPSTGRHV